MGVTGLWTVVQPCARPIKLETLNKKRLAVDASIWIYQFLKAVRDKEGNALRNSHVVGFFRRICKLLFFGIKPVFVFDGGAPALKRQTVSGRKARREGRREDALRTAGKLLAVQMQRRAEEEDRTRRENRNKPRQEDQGEDLPENLVYVDELDMTAQERQQNRQFKKKDQYHLPDLDVSLAEMGAPNDPRVMSHEELEEYARHFHSGEDVNVYDFSKIDFNSPFFLSLPASDRYNILNAARLRSRLRMGYSKDQLDTMFPDRMAFSRFQIERVAERNELTQRLMNINGMNGEDAMFGLNGGGRVAGEKGKEYVLVKNEGVEGGWALGVVSNKNEGGRNKPIDVERLAEAHQNEKNGSGGDSDDDDFEDVPVEGLNRLPKRTRNAESPDYGSNQKESETSKRRQALYDARKRAAAGREISPQQKDNDPDSLFMPEGPQQNDQETDDENDALFEDAVPSYDDGDDDLSRAIAMSLEDPLQETISAGVSGKSPGSSHLGSSIDPPIYFSQNDETQGRSVAHIANARANNAVPRFNIGNGDEDDIDLQASRIESSRTENDAPKGLPAFKAAPGNEKHDRLKPATPESSREDLIPEASKEIGAPNTGFDGPLPFESMKFTKSMLTKRKKKPVDEEAGGFEKQSTESRKPPQPLPPWFKGDVLEGQAAQRAFESREVEGGSLGNETTESLHQPVLKRHRTSDVIDLDAQTNEKDEVIEVTSSNGEEASEIMDQTLPIDSEVRMGDVADLIRAEPPASEIPYNDSRPNREPRQNGLRAESLERDGDDSDEPIEWEESDVEGNQDAPGSTVNNARPAGGNIQHEIPRSPSPEFENVGVLDSPTAPQTSTTFPMDDADSVPFLPHDASFDQQLDAVPQDDDGIYSDAEEENLMRQLAAEAEEHARFASTLNSKSYLENQDEYEKELRQLRNQQKKDRRDADEVSHIMVTECQQLLKLFGLPYITAPMEAEAQCAELVSLGLVDGIVTDDSDIFLFGGTRVYKNMFNQAKFVECYLSSDLEKEYSLTRTKLIHIAHLLGSDYTEGLPSVGPVTALEILSEFPDLDAFRDWWTHVQSGRPLPTSDNASPFRRKFKRNATKIFLPPVFPDKRVDHAYLHPEVDSDPSAFAWGVPDLDALRGFLMATIGWSQERTDEVLVPVVKDMNRRENEGTQANITQFFGGGVGVGARQQQSGSGAFAPRRRGLGKSARMESALGRLHAQAMGSLDGGDEVEQRRGDEGKAGVDDGKAAKKTKNRSRGTKRAAPKDPSDGVPASDSTGGDEYVAARKPKSRKKGAAKRKT
ncbi:DNA repair protein rad2 [Loxospora ochrophaea]|nr:DNA repair protein rad2 [Loxospora ochrophaea]